MNGIVIFCTGPDGDGRPTHEHTIVADLEAIADSGSGRWRPASVFPGMESVVQYIDTEDDPILSADRVAATFGPVPDVARVRYRLSCRACGDAHRYRSESIEPVLDDLSSTGVSIIPLKELASKIRSAARLR